MIQIAAIILNYNTYPHTIRLVGELQKQTIAGEMRIVVVDNASPNGSYGKLKPLEELYPNVVVLQTGENLGYARGNNFGLRYLDTSVKPCYVAILNNDVHLPDHCFEILCRRYRELDLPGVIAPVMFNEQGVKTQLSYQLNSFTKDCLRTLCVYRFFADIVNRIKSSDPAIRDMKVDIVPGSFLFSSADVLKRIGGFYPGTFLYSEERFIAFKIKEAGLQNYIIQDQAYIHAHNSPTISSVYDDLAKYKMMYDGWVEYARVCRKSTRRMVLLLKLLSAYSLYEILLINKLKQLLKRRV